MEVCYLKCKKIFTFDHYLCRDNGKVEVGRKGREKDMRKLKFKNEVKLEEWEG